MDKLKKATCAAIVLASCTIITQSPANASSPLDPPVPPTCVEQPQCPDTRILDCAGNETGVRECIVELNPCGSDPCTPPPPPPSQPLFCEAPIAPLPDIFMFNLDRFNHSTLVTGLGNSDDRKGFRLNAGDHFAIHSKGSCFVCYDVLNQSAVSYFIPNNTPMEYDSFVKHPPSGVTIKPCELRFTRWDGEDELDDKAATWLNGKPLGTPLNDEFCSTLDLDCDGPDKDIEITRGCEISLGKYVDASYCLGDERILKAARDLGTEQTLTCEAPTHATNPEKCPCTGEPPVANDDLNFMTTSYMVLHTWLHLWGSGPEATPFGYGVPGTCTLDEPVESCFKKVFGHTYPLLGSHTINGFHWTSYGALYDIRLHIHGPNGESVLANDLVSGDVKVTVTKQPPIGRITHVGNGHFTFDPATVADAVALGKNLCLDTMCTSTGAPNMDFEYTVTNECGSSTAKVKVRFVLISSPLVVDIDGDGVNVITIEKSKVKFDLELNGKPQHAAWIGPKDAFLVLDLNQNGRIDDRGEMFGNQNAANGFALLAQRDKNGDEVIDAADDVYDQLQLWFDKNSDGMTQMGELKKLPSAGIASIDLNSISTRRFVDGQLISDESTVKMKDETTRPIVDMWFEIKP